MSSVSTLPTRAWVGRPRTASGPARFDGLASEPPLNPTEFAQAVRHRRWGTLIPLLAASAAGAALLWTAAAPPPAARARQLYADHARSEPSYADPAADFRYELAPNWAWPALSSSNRLVPTDSEPSASACAGPGVNRSC